ncbi:ATP-binding protein [Candidatus Woesearchaeota archaeon]|nr:ATP-binding protein [Candidatus Woesearchaeota archaeon]
MAEPVYVERKNQESGSLAPSLVEKMEDSRSRRYHGEKIITLYTLATDLKQGRELRHRLEKDLRLMGYDDGDIDSILLCTNEHYNNATQHSRETMPDGIVKVFYRITRDRFKFVTEQENPWEKVPDFDTIQEPDLESPRGRGLFLMKKYMTEMKLEKKRVLVIEYRK